MSTGTRVAATAPAVNPFISNSIAEATAAKPANDSATNYKKFARRNSTNFHRSFDHATQQC
jgi:hypothetical protein